MPWRVRWTFVSEATNSVGTQFHLTPPGRSAESETRPWYVRVLDSTGNFFSKKLKYIGLLFNLCFLNSFCNKQVLALRIFF